VFTKEHKRKQNQQIDITELELEEPADKTELLELQPVPERGEAKMIEGDSQEAAVQLLKLLRDDAKVLRGMNLGIYAAEAIFMNNLGAC
jgi:hypothetical protein